MLMSLSKTEFHRYQIETETAPDIVPWPSRFKVKVNRPQLAKLLLMELAHYPTQMDVVLSRPCIYGVFSGPLGGFLPREKACVGCLRCTTQYPDIIQILPNPDRARLGDGYFTSSHVNAVAYEAETGRIPVKGAGYRGRFGGTGWDGMWTDMSEIVRPTRDGIHGREYISTAVDLGSRPAFLEFDLAGNSIGLTPRTFSLPVPFLFDLPPGSASSETCNLILARAAQEIDTLAVLPLSIASQIAAGGPHVVPLVAPADRENLTTLGFEPLLVEIDGWDPELWAAARKAFPSSQIGVRLPFNKTRQALVAYEAGVAVFHFIADYHGRSPDGRFVHDLIRQAHQLFVDEGCRQSVTLLASGGIIAAEHVPKAIIAGLDAVALDTVPLVALQARFRGECQDRHSSRFELPANLTVEWGVQRLKNLAAAWRDQLLEVLGAMGMREVRRLRGEIGRVMYQKDLEREAFADIEGYHD